MSEGFEHTKAVSSKLTPANSTEFLSRYLPPGVVPLVVDVARSYGNRLVDAITGEEFIDCFSYIASNPIGHNHPGLSDPKFEQELLRAAKTKVSNSDFYTLEMADFVKTFVEIALPKEFTHLFFIQGGALAVENALKTAFDWKVRKNFEKGQKEEKGHQVIHLREAFHGRSGYTLSLTNTKDPRKTKFFPKFNWPRVTNPKLSFPVTDEVLKAVIKAEEQSIAEIEQAFAAHPDDIAAIILEPIQGEGGDNHFRPEFHAALRRLADEHEALLIYDEVQTGVGLTGRMWAYEHYGIIPDIVCFGKKMQVCGIFTTSRIDEVPNNVFVEPSRINSTWGGDFASMIRAKRYLEIIQEEHLVNNAAVVGQSLLQILERFSVNYEDSLSNPRGRGLLCSVDASSVEVRTAIMSGLRERGVLALVCGERAIRFRPSLNFSDADVEELAGRFEDTLKSLRS